MLTRRFTPFLRRCLALALLGLLLMARPAWSQPLRLQVLPGNIASLYPFLSVEQGFYKQAGLDVQIVAMNSGVQASSAMASKSIDVIMNMPDNMILLKQRGFNSVVIMGNAVQFPFFLIAADQPGLKVAQKSYTEILPQLKDRTVGVYGLGTSTDRFVQQLVRGAGLPDNYLNRTATGGPAQTLAMLKTGKMGLFSDVYASGLLAEQMGLGKIILDCAHVACPDTIEKGSKMALAYFTRDDYLAQNPDHIRRLVQAHAQADAWMRQPENQPALLAALKKLLPVPDIAEPDRYYEQVAQRVPEFFGLKVSLSALQAIQQGLLEAGEIPAPMDMTDMIWAQADRAD